MKTSIAGIPVLLAAVAIVGLSLAPLDTTDARGVRGNTKTSVNKNVNHNRNTNANRNTNVNRNTNANRNTNVNANRNVNVNSNRNTNVNVDVDHHHHHRHGHPVAAVAVTAAVVGAIVYSLPPSCSSVTVGNVIYQQCGSTWYQPQYAGTTVQYIVVEAPR